MANNLSVFHQGGQDDGQLWYSFINPAFPNASADMQVRGAGMSDSPSAVVYNSLLYVFYQGSDENGQLSYSYSSDGIHWSEPSFWASSVPDQNLIMSGSPSAVVYNGLLYVFHQGGQDNGQLWYSYFDGTKWSADTPIENVAISESPSAVLWQGGITVFHQGSYQNGGLYYTYSPDGSHWGGDTPWGGDMPVQNLGMSGSPSAVVYNGLLYVFHQGGQDNGQLWYSYFDNTNWSVDTRIENVAISESPSALLWQGGISVLHQGSYENGGLYYTYSPDGSEWGGDTRWGGATPTQLVMSGSPGCVVF